MKRSSKFCTLALAAAMFILGGCSLVSRQEPLKPVLLKSYQGEAICRSAAPVQILVPMPHTSSGLSTDRIAILADGRLIEYARDYKWDDSNAAIIQRQLVDLLNSSGCFAGAGTGGMALRADYRLELDVKKLYFVSGSKPGAQVELLLRLVEVRSGNLVGQYSAAALQEVKDDSYAAMEDAIHAAMLDALIWLRANATAR